MSEFDLPDSLGITDDRLIKICKYRQEGCCKYIVLFDRVNGFYCVKNVPDIQIPVTHAKIFGWYDNEFGSYVSCLGRLTEYVDKRMT